MTEEQLSDDLYAKHIKIQNRWISGFYQNIRSFTIWITLTGFFCLPWVTWNGRQALLFDVSARRFYLFGITFWPQDFFLLLLLLLSSAISLIAITNLAGRIWCGYTCPQTVWTKCFMWLEYMIEGDRGARLKRDKNPWEAGTLTRRVIKHISWILLALITAETFVGYFIPIRHVLLFDINGWGVFWISFFTLATYLNAGWMREQVCLYICPYARFQSVMFDRNTLTVAYDYNRGEPRGSRKINSDKGSLGDCIDCKLCVQVCPTGIDIRNGLQMACIGCAACIDACDSIMDKMHYPRGLIRYATENALKFKKTKIIRPRLLASVLLLLIILSTLGYQLITRIPLQFSVLHDHQNLYRMTANGNVENYYTMTIGNMSQKDQHLSFKLTGNDWIHYIGPENITLAPGELRLLPVTLIASPGQINQFSTPVHFSVINKNDGVKLIEKDANFFRPNQ